VVATRRRPPRWFQISARRQDPGPDGQACAVISVADISPVRALAPEVFDQLVRDPLTMLLNRRAVDSMVDGDELGATSHVAAVVVGINRFQSISDLHGHQVSDRCLVEVARALTVAAGESDVISRPYGDEFVIFCGPDSPVPDVLRDWGVREIIADGRRILISLQVGLSVRERGQSLRDVIRQAEQAYSHVALRTGEAVQVWTPAIADEARQRDADESRVRELIASARLVAHFQPVVDVRTGGIRGFEALLRDTVTGLSPQLIVDTARSLGLAGELHRQIITDVLDRAPAIFRAYPGVRIAINVAREQFVSGEVVDTILAATDFGANPLCSLAIEVTEELAANIDPSMLQLQMRRCVAAGVPVMIDDFGRGETSLSLLRDLEFTAIKMDRSLLPLDDDDLSWRFVEGAVGMLRTLTTEVIAEGVETSAQSRRLLDLGVSRQQGFLFGRAEPAVSWLAHPWPVAAPS
jgi:diguanylate cyclase (GGDEF)-like protein